MTCRTIGVASPSSSFGWAAHMPAIPKTSLRDSKKLHGSMPTCGRYAYSRPSSSCAYTLRGRGSVLPIGQHRGSLAFMISVEACGAQLYKYMKLHGMLSYPAGLWYGYELPVTWFKRSYSNPSWRSRTKEDRKFGAYERPPAAALDHPKTPSTAFGSRSGYPLLLPSAKRLEQMPLAARAATEHAFEIKRKSLSC